MNGERMKERVMKRKNLTKRGVKYLQRDRLDK